MDFFSGHGPWFSLVAVATFGLLACGGSSSQGPATSVDVTGSMASYSFKAADGVAGSYGHCDTAGQWCDLALGFSDFSPFSAACDTLSPPPGQYITIRINVQGQSIPGVLDPTPAWVEFVRVTNDVVVAQNLSVTQGTITIDSLTRGAPTVTGFPTTASGRLDVTFDSGWLRGTFQVGTECH